MSVRAVTLSRKEAGNAFHTSRDSTSDPKGRLIFRKRANIVASSAGVVLRQPGFLPRVCRGDWNLCTTDRIVATGVFGSWMSLAMSL